MAVREDPGKSCSIYYRSGQKKCASGTAGKTGYVGGSLSVSDILIFLRKKEGTTFMNDYTLKRISIRM